MSLSMECYGLQHMIDDEEQVRALLFLTARTGKKIPAYSGLYCNKYYKSLQIVVGEIINHETKSLEIQSGHTHNTGNSFWKCRVIQEINPEEYGDLDMRLLVEPISGQRSMTVIDVINADILPSYAPGEIIDLQVVAKARSATFYPDEASFDEAEGQKTSIPMNKDGKREERYLSLAAGFPMPSGYMHNHTVQNEDDRQGIPNTDDDKWVYLRGTLVDKLGYYPCQLPGKEDKPVNHPLPAGIIDTYFGKIHIMYNHYGLSRQQQELVKKGNTVSVVCNIQGDALIDEYEEGIVINKKNNLMAVRYALSSGRMKRLLPVLADNCTLHSEARDLIVTGKEAVVDYLDERSRSIVDQRKTYTIYGIIKNSEKETVDNNLKYKAGERCVVIGKGEISEGDYSQIVFLDFDEEEKVCRLYLSSDSNYRFDKYASWEEMDRNSPENIGKSPAYWRAEKVFVDYLNRYGNHKLVENALCSILDQNTVMEYGSARYEGAEKVLEFLEGTSNAISSDDGFIARPVIINDEGKKIKAVALCSKLEDYVSWYFFLYINDETGKVHRISGKRGQDYTHVIDHYEERNFVYEDPVPEEDVVGDYGPFKVIGRGGSVHMPQVLEPEGFGAAPGLGVLKDYIFGGEKASTYYREYKEIKTAKEKEKHMRLEGPDFLLEYRTNTDRYLPLPDIQYQHFDEWEEEIIRNLCWGAGLLEENRPYFAEFWKVFGVTSLTVTVSSKDTEPAKIVQMIQNAGLIECINPDRAEIHFKKYTDDHGNEFIGVNSVIGKEDDDNAEQYLFWKGKTHRFEELNAMNEKEGK